MKETEPQEAGISHTVFAEGNSDWYRNVAAPFAEAIEEVIQPHIGDFPVALRQRMNRGTVNEFLGYAVIAVAVFVTKKIGDNFWDVMLKPRVQKCFEWLDGRLTGGNRKARKIFISSIWYKEYNVVVSVSVIGKDFAEVVSQLNLLSVVHSNAFNWIALNGVSAPVHHYRIESGKVNAEPLLLQRVDHTAGDSHR
jgi:hypothetical protein